MLFLNNGRVAEVLGKASIKLPAKFNLDDALLTRYEQDINPSIESEVSPKDAAFLRAARELADEIEKSGGFESSHDDHEVYGKKEDAPVAAEESVAEVPADAPPAPPAQEAAQPEVPSGDSGGQGAGQGNDEQSGEGSTSPAGEQQQ